MIDVDIGRVIFVNANKYTIDLMSINGNQYQDVPFLSLYSKPNSSGQGVYMMPERDSYALIVKIKNDVLGAERFALGFFNPLNDTGGYSGDREKIEQGDFVAKTVFGNTIIGRTDGSITLKASDQSQFTMFPSSGNKQDSWGYDNLLRAIFENIEISTDAGHIQQKVNKKEKTTNINFEVRNKPLYSEDPQVIRGDIGSQGPMGDPQYFKTIEVIDIVDEEEILRQELKWKTNGYTKHIINNPDGILLTEITITSDYDRNIKNYQVSGSSSNLLYEKDVLKDGTRTVTHYVPEAIPKKKSEYFYKENGYYKKTIWNTPGTNDCYVMEIDEFGNTKQIIKNAEGSQVLKETKNSSGVVNIELGTTGEINLTLDGSTGDITLSAKNNSSIQIDGASNVNVGKGSTVNVGKDSSLTAGGNIDLTASGNANVNAANANVTAGTINLNGKTNCGGGGPAVARLGDQVQVVISGGSSAGTYTGEIIQGASNTFAG